MNASNKSAIQESGCFHPLCFSLSFDAWKRVFIIHESRSSPALFTFLPVSESRVQLRCEDGQLTAGRVPPPPSGPIRGQLGGQQPIRGESWRKCGRCSGRTPGGPGPRMLRGPRPCAQAGWCLPGLHSCASLALSLDRKLEDKHC